MPATSLADTLSDALGALHRPPVILCIGSDRVTGDALGPFVGSLLSDKGYAPVLGTLSSPVTALNLESALLSLKREHAGKKVIAVDSCIGEASELGKIGIRRGSLRPGLACGKSLPLVGDVSITATVASGKADNLYAVRLGFILPLAAKIADAISYAITIQDGNCMGISKRLKID